MSKFFEYDPFTGVRYDTEDSYGDDIIVNASQNVQPHLDAAAKMRNSGEADLGIKRDFWHYCTIPTSVEIELKGKGIEIHNKNHLKALLKEINTNYPHLKMTRLHHG